MADDPTSFVDAPHTTLEVAVVRPPARPPLQQRIGVLIVAVALILAVPAGIYVGTLSSAGVVATPTGNAAVAGSFATSATISFTRVNEALTLSQTTLVAATDGSGQIPATALHVSIRAAVSQPIDAPYVASRGAYVVPRGCGDHGPAYDAAFKGITYQLNSRSPGGTVVYAGPDIGFDDGSFYCYPTPGTASSEPFTYNEYIDGYGFHGYYRLVDAQNVQIARLQKLVPAHQSLIGVQTCTGTPKMSNANEDHVTITCPTSGTAAWNWPPEALSALANGVVGQTPQAAQRIIAGQPGVVAGSVVITLSNGSRLPRDAGAMTLAVSP